MKKVYVLLTVFSGISILSFIFSIVTLAVLPDYTYDYSLFLAMLYLSSILSLVSAIGTFVCSIVGLVNSKHLVQGKGLAISTCILGIVASSILFISSIVAMATAEAIPSLVGNIGLLVTFGLSIAVCVKTYRM